MILLDTSVWIDHIRVADSRIDALLGSELVSIHPFIVGELAIGSLKNRQTLLESFNNLPKVKLASDAEVLDFITAENIFSLGLSYIDAHLLLSAQITANTRLWTRDKAMRSVADRLSLSYEAD